jgi:hypothetical protein
MWDEEPQILIDLRAKIASRKLPNSHNDNTSRIDMPDTDEDTLRDKGLDTIRESCAVSMKSIDLIEAEAEDKIQFSRKVSK